MTELRAHQAGFKSILCPVDFSADAGRALRCASLLARRWRSRVTVMYAIHPMLASAASVSIDEPSCIDRSDRELRAFGKEALGSRLHRGLSVDYITRVGHPADEVLTVAAAVKADVILMGTHGLTGPTRLMLGSTTRSVLHRTTLPVLAVPNAGTSGWILPPSWPSTRIVAAVDLNASAKDLVLNAARIAGWFHLPLLLTHVIPDVRVPAWMQAALTAHERIRIDKARARLDEFAAAIKKRPPRVECRVVCGNPADEIAALVASERADIVVTALDRRSGWFGGRRGSVSYHVLSYASAPVLALPR